MWMRKLSLLWPVNLSLLCCPGSADLFLCGLYTSDRRPVFSGLRCILWGLAVTSADMSNLSAVKQKSQSTKFWSTVHLHCALYKMPITKELMPPPCLGWLPSGSSNLHVLSILPESQLWEGCLWFQRRFSQEKRTSWQRSHMKAAPSPGSYFRCYVTQLPRFVVFKKVPPRSSSFPFLAPHHGLLLYMIFKMA